MKTIDEIMREVEKNIDKWARNWQEERVFRWGEWNECEKCGYKSPAKSAIHKHHRSPLFKGDTYHLITLCANCHRSEHGKLMHETKICEICGYETNLSGVIQRHHVVPKEMDKEKIAKDVVMDICANCHYELHDFLNHRIDNKPTMSGKDILDTLKVFTMLKKDKTYGWK